MIVGGWARRRSTDFGPFFVYAAILFAFSALVSAVHVPGGTFIHSAVALAPYSYILALEGIVVVVAWVAARRPAWDRDVGATRCFGGATIAFAVVRRVRSARSSSTPPGRPVRDAALAVAHDARRGRRAPERPGDVDRRVEHQVLVGPRRRRPGQRPARHDPRGRHAPTTSAGWSSTAPIRSSAVAPILDGGPLPAWLGPPIMSQGSPTELAVYPVLPTPAAGITP